MSNMLGTFTERKLLQLISSKSLRAPRFEEVLTDVCQRLVSWQLCVEKHLILKMIVLISF